MANFDSTARVGRSQGAIIFWGLVSVFFAAAFCYYYWKNLENESSARQLRDEVLTLQSDRETLSSEKQRLQASISDTQKQLDTREEFLQEKETKLAAEESRLESLGLLTQTQTQQGQGQASAVKKFDDTVRKLSKDNDGFDVVLRGGRPVLRVPSTVFFAVGDAALKPDGKTLFNQIAQAVNGQIDNFELRVENYTDGDAEIEAADAPPPAKPGQKPSKPAPADDATSKSHFATGWDLTAGRATAISRFFRDQTTLPFQNVIVVARADFQPIVPNGKDGHARNRRVEITITPVPTPYQAADVAKAKGDKSPDKSPPTLVDPLAPPPDAPASGNKGN